MGGLFDEAGGVPAANVARFDGRRWRDVDGGTDGRVRAVFDYGTTVVIGGDFARRAVRPARAWPTSSSGQWTPMGDGLPDRPNAFRAAQRRAARLRPVRRRRRLELQHDRALGRRRLARRVRRRLPGQRGLRPGPLATARSSTAAASSTTPSIPTSSTSPSGTAPTSATSASAPASTSTRCSTLDNGIYVGGDFADTGVTASWGLVYLTPGRELHPVAQPHVPRTVVDLDVWNDVLVVGQTDAVIPYNGLAWLDTLGGVLDGELNCALRHRHRSLRRGLVPGHRGALGPLRSRVGAGGRQPRHQPTTSSNRVRALCVHDGPAGRGGRVLRAVGPGRREPQLQRRLVGRRGLAPPRRRPQRHRLRSWRSTAAT